MIDSSKIMIIKRIKKVMNWDLDMLIGVKYKIDRNIIILNNK